MSLKPFSNISYEFNCYLLKVAKELTSNDVDQLKFIFKNVIPPANSERTKEAFHYFHELERRCLLSPTKLDVLKDAFDTIGRNDLVEALEEKEEYFATLSQNGQKPAKLNTVNGKNEGWLLPTLVPENQVDKQILEEEQYKLCEDVVHDGVVNDAEAKGTFVGEDQNAPNKDESEVERRQPLKDSKFTAQHQTYITQGARPKGLFSAEDRALEQDDKDFSHLFDRVSKDTKGLEGAKPHLERVPVCSSILVTGLDKGTSDEIVELYFENSNKSGGGDVNGLERKAEDQAIVHFKDPSSVWEVMRKDHTLERKKLSVKPYYAFLGENASDKPRNSAAKDEVPKFIFHAVPLQSGDIKETILKCLQEAEKQGISSISFPAIGTGNLGMSAKSSAGAMMNAVYKFSLQNPGSVALVRVVVFAQDLLPDFRSAMAEASGEKPAGQPTMWSRFKNFIGFGDDQDSTEPSPTIGDSYEKELNLFIYAGRRQDLQNAAEAVKEVMTENSSTKLIENKAISDLTERHRRQIRTLELKYDVEISVEVVVARIVVRGHSYDVLNAVGDIHEILHKLKDEEHDRHQAEILAKSVQWSFKENEVYEEFEPLLNAQIESAYDQKKYKTIITLDEERVELNFQAMTLTDLTTRDTTELRRVDHREGVNAPDYWVPQPKNLAGKEVPVHVLELTAVYNPKEFKDVSDKFCQTCPNNPIQKIERVQNLALYGTYAIRRKGMDERNGSNEMQLFHGTAGDSCDKINHAGFNRGFCGKNATMFGNGVYFAKDASYSARPQYSPPDANWLRYMYLARVLVGEYAVGHPGLILPPQRNQHDETDRYDSAVDQLGNPGIFVAFYDWQCYPEYLITFK